MGGENRFGRHPPRVPLTIRVGVTGHRDPSYLTSEPLSKTVGRILGTIADFTRGFPRTGHSPFEENSPPQLRLISALAEGADQLAARIALSLGYELECPLATPEDHLKDSSGAKDEMACQLLTQAGQRFLTVLLPKDQDEAFEIVGLAVAHHSDVVIAIWDRAAARGRGGTATVVQEVLRRRVPIVIIDPTEPDQVMLRHGNLDEPIDPETLCELLRRSVTVQSGRRPRRQLGVLKYLNERRPWRLQALVRRTIGRFQDWRNGRDLRPLRALAASEAEWNRSWKDLREELAGIRNWIDRAYRVHFCWADSLAEHYRDRCQILLISTYLMSALAVTAAFFGLFSHGDKKWASLELIFLFLIVAHTALARWRRWHERWVDYRFLAEGIRQLQFLTPLLRDTAAFRLPQGFSHGDPRRHWANTCLQALVRSAGLPIVRIDQQYIQGSRELLSRWSRSQADYHQDKADQSERQHSLLGFIGTVLFGAAVLGCILELTCSEASKIVSYLVIGLPAFGAAVAAIHHNREPGRVADLSEAVGNQLERISNDLACTSKKMSFSELGAAADQTSTFVLRGLLDWRYLFLDKEPSLPG